MPQFSHKMTIAENEDYHIIFQIMLPVDNSYARNSMPIFPLSKVQRKHSTANRKR